MRKEFCVFNDTYVSPPRQSADVALLYQPKPTDRWEIE